MKLTKISDQRLTRTREVPGLLSSCLEYEIKSGQGRLQYTGPKFTPRMWHEVLSFFRWTHETMNSESQVRLYVNSQLGRWGAWAFPQEARTGMNAREIAVPETPEQACERFASWDSIPSDDWLYFGTAHHHCAASAFQSGTDEANERHQDGLHLTVGRLEAERYDLHARFYLEGNCFEPDLSVFWPVDPELATRVPSSMHDALARFAMGEKAVVDFPEAWRRNVIEVEVPRRKLQFDGDLLGLENSPVPSWVRLEAAIREIARECEPPGGTQDEEFLATLEYLSGNSLEGIIVRACLKHGVLPEELLEEIKQYELPG